MLDTFFEQFAADLIMAFKKIGHMEYEKFLEYYVTIQANIDEAEKAVNSAETPQPHNQ
jgi:hypothetical protein